MLLHGLSGNRHYQHHHRKYVTPLISDSFRRISHYVCYGTVLEGEAHVTDSFEFLTKAGVVSKLPGFPR